MSQPTTNGATTMKTITLLTALILLATPAWAGQAMKDGWLERYGNMPKELLGEWCQAENHDDRQIYSRAPSVNCNKKSTMKLHITDYGLFMLRTDQKRGVLCAAPRDFEKDDAGVGTYFKADCGFDDNSSGVHTFSFFMYPMLKKSLGVVISSIN
jgi:hypothetical protein